MSHWWDCTLYFGHKLTSCSVFSSPDYCIALYCTVFIQPCALNIQTCPYIWFHIFWDPVKSNYTYFQNPVVRTNELEMESRDGGLSIHVAIKRRRSHNRKPPIWLNFICLFVWLDEQQFSSGSNGQGVIIKVISENKKLPSWQVLDKTCP